MPRWAKITIAVAVVLVTSPVWGFELLYRLFLPADRPALPAATQATQFEQDALWVVSGERLGTQQVTPVWALNFFRVDRWPGEAVPGRNAIRILARSWTPPSSDVVNTNAKRRSNLRRVVAEISTSVCLSLNASIDDLKRGLAERSYFGQGLLGFANAKKAWYGCSVSTLTTAQVALLAALPEAPSQYDPRAHPDRAAARTGYVLKRFAQAGLISEAELTQSRAEDAIASVVPAGPPCQ